MLRAAFVEVFASVSVTDDLIPLAFLPTLLDLGAHTLELLFLKILSVSKESEAFANHFARAFVEATFDLVIDEAIKLRCERNVLCNGLHWRSPLIQVLSASTVARGPLIGKL